jgi:hypothetical protein
LASIVEEVVAQLKPEERIASLKPEEIVTGLTPEQIAALKQILQMEPPAAQR